MADIKLFAATFLSGAAEALTEKQQTVFGPITSPSLANAPFEGAQKVLSIYAQRIYEAIQKDGFYVRVPSGKQFYLYVLQTIDRADADIGGSAKPFVEATATGADKLNARAALTAVPSALPSQPQPPDPTMKHLALIPLVFVASCASRPQLVVRPAPPAAVEPVESVRYDEVVRAYHVGRQVDPNHPDMMTEGHPVYRVEVFLALESSPRLAKRRQFVEPAAGRRVRAAAHQRCCHRRDEPPARGDRARDANRPRGFLVLTRNCRRCSAK